MICIFVIFNEMQPLTAMLIVINLSILIASSCNWNWLIAPCITDNKNSHRFISFTYQMKIKFLENEEVSYNSSTIFIVLHVLSA